MGPKRRASASPAPDRKRKTSASPGPDFVTCASTPRKRAKSSEPSLTDVVALTTPTTKRRERASSIGIPDEKRRRSLPGVSKHKLINTIPIPLSHAAPLRLAYCGDGLIGQFGEGVDKLSYEALPVIHNEVDLARDLEDLACGSLHNILLDSVGRVWTFGINDNGPLGRSTTADDEKSIEELESRPMLASGLENQRVVRVYAGDSFSAALTEEGALYAAGAFRGSEGLLGLLRSSLISYTFGQHEIFARLTITQVACGMDHLLALTADGLVYSWGNGEQGQLGRKIIQRRRTSGLFPEKLSLKNICTIGAGHFHSFAVEKDGTVWACGLNSLRQTGVTDLDGGRESTVPNPRQVKLLHPVKNSGHHVVQITGGEHHTLFLFNDGSVKSVGRCDGFECGLGEDNPAMLESAARRSAAAAKDHQALEKTSSALDLMKLTDGQDAAVQISQLSGAQAGSLFEFIPEPTAVTFPEGVRVKQLVSGPRHNFAVSTDGRLFSFGFSPHKALGFSEETLQTIPREILMEGKSLNVAKAASGNRHCMLLLY